MHRKVQYIDCFCTCLKYYDPEEDLIFLCNPSETGLGVALPQGVA